jgi:prepilin-type N-terminal cleavage/methylation domain-containing protein
MTSSRSDDPVPGAGMPGEEESGYTMLELLIVAAIVVILGALTVPVTSATIDSHRIRQAANFVASRLRYTRQQAVYGNRAFAMVFDEVGGRWVFQVCSDGNYNGVRRLDIALGFDPCVEGPQDIETMFRGTKVAVDPAIRGPAGEPGSIDPVRFGRSSMLSCSLGGTCTAGSLYLQSPNGTQYAVRVFGATGRTRVLRYERATSRWVDF